MALYFISNQAIPGFRVLCSLSDNDLENLSEVIKNTPVGDGIKDIVENNEEKFSNLSWKNFRDLISSIFNAAGLFAKSDLSPEEFANIFTESIKETDAFFNLNEGENFRANFIKLLPNFSNLSRTILSRAVLTSNVNNFKTSTFVSDIRIVFDNSQNKSNHVQDQDAVIIHNLKIEYFSKNENKEFYVSLNSKDLLLLKKSLEDAIKKDENIKRTNNQFKFLEIR